MLRSTLFRGLLPLVLLAIAGCRAASPVSSATAAQVTPQVERLLDELRADMVVVPEGRFQMGSATGQGDDEQPVHTVSVPSFMVSRYEVTAAQFATFEEASGRAPVSPEQPAGTHPATHISWEDADAFIAWLNGLSDLKYRLPSEAEWEYAARGRSAGAYWWGDSYLPGNVNGSGLSETDLWAGTAPVGSLAPNAYGLYNVLGNVWEWTADCYFPDYVGAPDDGSARLGDETCGRVLRGGSWSDTPAWLRTSTRNWFDRADRFDYVGLRLAADLTLKTAGEGR